MCVCTLYVCVCIYECMYFRMHDTFHSGTSVERRAKGLAKVLLYLGAFPLVYFVISGVKNMI